MQNKIERADCWFAFPRSAFASPWLILPQLQIAQDQITIAFVTITSRCLRTNQLRDAAGLQ